VYLCSSDWSVFVRCFVVLLSVAFLDHVLFGLIILSTGVLISP
jgi:hypothetical protein